MSLNQIVSSANDTSSSVSTTSLDDSGGSLSIAGIHTPQSPQIMNKTEQLTVDTNLPSRYTSATTPEQPSDLTPPNTDRLLLATTSYRTPTFFDNIPQSDSIVSSHIPTTVGVYTYNMASPYRCSNINSTPEFMSFNSWQNPSPYNYNYRYCDSEPEPLNLSVNAPTHQYYSNHCSAGPEQINMAYPWGGVSASSYQEWLSSMQQQYQAMGKNTVNWNNVMPQRVSTSTPKDKPLSVTQSMEKSVSGIPASDFDKPSFKSHTADEYMFQTIQDNLRSIVNRYKSNSQPAAADHNQNNVIQKEAVSIENINIQPIPIAPAIPKPLEVSNITAGSKTEAVPKRVLKKNFYNKEQTDQLAALYDAFNYPTAEQKSELADRLGISLKQVTIWFNNRRSKQKRFKKSLSAPTSAQESSNPGSAFYPEIYETPPPCSSASGVEQCMSMQPPAPCVFVHQPPVSVYQLPI